MKRVRITYRNALYTVLLFQLLFFLSYPLNGDVVFFNDNSLESGNRSWTISEGTEKNEPDLATFIIPFLHHQLKSDSSSWLPTWDPHSELGKFLIHRQSMSRAFLITNLPALFTDNPFILHTLLSTLTVMLMSIFMFFFLKELNLHPVACAISALGISMANVTIWFLSQVSFNASTCWTICLLWLITKFICKKTPLISLGISFAVYCLFMSGYIQYIVAYAYLLIGYAAIKIYHQNAPFRQKTRTLVYLGLLAAAGIVAASPVYIDIAFMSIDSIRHDMARIITLGSFHGKFGQAKLSDIYSATLSLLMVFDGFLFGDPWILDSLPTSLRVRITPFSPLFFCLFLFSLSINSIKKRWLWLVYMGFFILLKISAPAYEFAVNYLGFHISFIQPLYVIIIPVHVLAAYAIDDILHQNIKGKLVPIVVLSFMIALCILSIIAVRQLEVQAPIDMKHLIAAAIITIGTILFAAFRKQSLIIFIMAISIYFYGFETRIAYPLKDIHLSSPIMEIVRKHTKVDYRFVKVGQWNFFDFFPVMQEPLYGISSIHSFNSLASKNYLQLANSLGLTDPTGLGRYLNHTPNDNRLKGPDFSYTGVNLLLSRNALDPKYFRMVDAHYFRSNGIYSGIGFYTPFQKPILEVQTSAFKLEHQHVFMDGYLQEHNEYQIERTVDLDDLKIFKVASISKPTLLFISQQYNRFWEAWSDRKRLDTIKINGFYQGAILPPGTKEVTLRFKPYVLWSWIPQVLFPIAGVALILRRLKKKPPSSPSIKWTCKQ